MRPVSLAFHVLQNKLGGVPRPRWCTFVVCFRCNARCPMCDSWRMKPGDEMSVEEIETVFGKIGQLDIVRITGGEPFLRGDLSDVAGAILHASQPTVVHVTTNGSFPERIASFVERFPQPSMLRFMVSFDGMQAEHDRSRGAEVSFATAMESVRLLASLRDRCGLNVSANHTVISPQSLLDNDGLRRELGRYDVDVHSVLAYAESSMYGVKLRGRRADHMIVPRGYPLHPALEGADVVGLVERELARVGACRDPFARFGKEYYLRGLLARVRCDAQAEPRPKCVALRSHIRLLPDGSVPVCQFNTEKVGNLLRQSFEEVWGNGESTASREWVDGCPGCWAECEVMPNAIYSGDLFGQ